MLSFSSTQTKPSPLTPNLYPSSHSISHSLITSSSTRKPQKNQTHLNLQRLRVRAIDAAQPFDYETRIKTHYQKSNTLKIAIIGFGNFGQFLAKTLVQQGHTVLAQSRSDYSKVAENVGVSFFTDPHDLCEQHPEVVLLCTSILSTEKVIKSFPFQRLRRNTLFVDVLSVKEFPRDLLLKYLPDEFDILCTHPMFGPQSGKNSWVNLPFVYDKVRIGNNGFRFNRCEKFLDIFGREGCRMVEMSCAEHDKHAAGSQFVTHTMGRVLEKFKLESSPISTKGYETLLNLVENTSGDSFDLYYGLFMYNKNAMEQLERLDMAFEALKKELFGHLQEVCRKQLFGTAEAVEIPREEEPAKSQKLLPVGAQNGSNVVTQNRSGEASPNGAHEGYEDSAPLDSASVSLR
ncbi:PREDICTED: arogenate dehydrogenase 2, chloroplastic [Prunus mume]|uniref:Arogenate dehydrogenase 2, chloroplastic n=1 Tax=Prunus mume TaxID=102107 RepID=A0ABM0NRC9_PRUMU|nr:PREDICTED: arogenate dehydrogenase 2, chloroplastic [Prunus mume]